MNAASLKDKVSAEEWQLRVDLAACYRLTAVYGWSDLIFTHISARPEAIHCPGSAVDAVDEVSARHGRSGTVRPAALGAAWFEGSRAGLSRFHVRRRPTCAWPRAYQRIGARRIA